MTTTWTVRDRAGRRLPGYDGHSKMEVGRKLVPAYFDAFRLEVSRSYRELFERAVAQILQREAWEIVRCEPTHVRFRAQSARRSSDDLAPAS